MTHFEILKSFAVLNRTFLAYFSSELAAKRLSYTHGVMVVNIGNRPGCTQDELAADLVIDKAAIARAVKELAAKRLVRVERDDEDLRQKHLFLTGSGKQLLQFIDRLNAKWIDAVTDDLTAAQRKTFFGQLGQLVVRAREPRP